MLPLCEESAVDKYGHDTDHRERSLRIYSTYCFFYAHKGGNDPHRMWIDVICNLVADMLSLAGGYWLTYGQLIEARAQLLIRLARIEYAGLQSIERKRQ